MNHELDDDITESAQETTRMHEGQRRAGASGLMITKDKSVRVVPWNRHRGALIPKGASKLEGAALFLKVTDDDVLFAVLALQRAWRAKMARRTKENHEKKSLVMRSHSVIAPAFFGESCLWQPVHEWGPTGVVSRHRYFARCDSRCELITISQDTILTLLNSFQPWLSKVFEEFREAICEDLSDGMIKRRTSHWAR